MRILEFTINKQRLLKKKNCDFTGLVAGSVGYLKAKFYFSEEWTKCGVKIVRFWLDGKEYAVKLDNSCSCDIPPEALTGDHFEVSVIGASTGYTIETSKITVKQGVY